MPPENVPSFAFTYVPQVGDAQQVIHDLAARLCLGEALEHCQVIEQVLGGHARVDAELLGKVAEDPAHRVFLPQHVELAEEIRPSSGSLRVATARISVVLPAPFGPRSPNIPGGIWRETSVSARTPPG